MTRYGQLRDCFTGIGVKRLTAVDADPARSNQHEIGTTRDMRAQFLGDTHRQEFRTFYVWLGHDQEGFTVEGTATHYDARERQDSRRPEWRLYYPSNAVTELMQEGDALFLARRNNGDLYFIVAASGSSSEGQLSWLFDMAPNGSSFVSREFGADETELDFAARFILDELGIEFEIPDADRLDSIIEQFGTEFPETTRFSAVARDTVSDVNARDDPDEALVAWLSQEEALFRRLERREIIDRFEKGFAGEDGVDTEAFIGFSLSVHNRRKSRMGRSLENHLEEVFRTWNLSYARGAMTENNHRPDFLFPGMEAYRNAPDTGDPCLTMLGAKSSCKERWRQVVFEALKIPEKHLLTLEPGISELQTANMKASNLQLVVPRSIHGTYTKAQQAWLWNLAEFVEHVRKQAGR